MLSINHSFFSFVVVASSDSVLSGISDDFSSSSLGVAESVVSFSFRSIIS